MKLLFAAFKTSYAETGSRKNFIKYIGNTIFLKILYIILIKVSQINLCECLNDKIEDMKGEIKDRPKAIPKEQIPSNRQRGNIETRQNSPLQVKISLAPHENKQIFT